MLIYAGLVLFFQIIISDFNQNMHTLKTEIEEMHRLDDRLL